MELNNLTAVVTGGASGLGGATAAMLAGLGAKVTIFDLNEEVGEAHAAVIGGLFARVDVADEESVSAGLDAAGSAYGITRLLVNCAGVAPAIKTVGKGNAPHPLGAFRRAVEINLVGRSEEHTSELQSLMRISYAVFCLK